MPIDAYSPCPGGTGKKIKFCCPDFLGQLEKIERMLEGDQHVACLKYIEQLEQQRADRPCLLAIKCMLLRLDGQLEAVGAAVAHFLDHHPDNPIALAESAMLTAANQGGRQAMEVLQRAIAATEKEVSSRVYEAIGTVAQVLLSEGHFPAARALLVLQATIDRQEERAVQMVMQLNRSPSVPLLVRDDRALDTCAEDAPWKAPFDEAMASVDSARWAEAAGKLEALAGQVPEAPVIWRNLAVLRGWVADTPGCVEALRKYASLDVPAEDAVEAEALALCLLDDPLGDRRDVCTLSYEVDDVEQLQAGLALAPRVVLSKVDPRRLADEGQPPPKAVYLLLDRPAPSSGQELTLQSIPRVLALARLCGRQTDREARLEVMRAIDGDVQQVRAVLDELVGQGLRPDPDRKVDGHLSASWDLLAPKPWLPDDVSREQIERLAEQQRGDTVISRWPDLAMGLLDGRSPREAATQPEVAVRLSAAVMLMELWSGQTGEPLDLNPLRTQLGLPVPGPIDPHQTPVGALPLVRLARVEAGKLSDEALVALFRRAVAFGVRQAMGDFGRELVARPTMAGREEPLLAYSLLARTERDPDRALEYTGEGRRAAEAVGHSSASWDLLELTLRLDRAEGEEAARLMRHVDREHGNEPGVSEALAETLVEYGLIHPDGTPVAPPEAEPPPAEAAAGPPAAEPGKLWTPDSQKPAEQKKLWTPGMD